MGKAWEERTAKRRGRQGRQRWVRSRSRIVSTNRQVGGARARTVGKHGTGEQVGKRRAEHGVGGREAGLVGKGGRSWWRRRALDVRQKALRYRGRWDVWCRVGW